MDVFSLGFSVSNLGPKSFQRLVNKFGSPKKAWEGSQKEFAELGIAGLTYKKFDKFRKDFDSVQYTGQLKKVGVKFVSFFDKEYPESFKRLENPPIGIFCKGNLKLLDSSPTHRMIRIAVVGTRKITQYGKSATESIVSDLAGNNICIVSGLALGVDGASHKVSLENNGLTIAVMPCGVDCCRPSENFSLYRKILDNNGLIISEYPLSTPPNKGTFLARNRLIAALSDGVLVTEAAEGSGSLVTAEWGLKLGKKVFAVPGPITSRMSDGSLKLLKKGAKLVTEGKDILQEFKINKKLKIKNEKEKYKKLSQDERAIVKLLENEEMTVDELSKRVNYSVPVTMQVLGVMEIKGIIKSINGRYKVI